jgi:hypothetical protein
MYFVFWVFYQDEEWAYVFCGEDSEGYIEFGGPDNDEILAWGYFDENGDLNIEGNEYEAEYDGVTYDEVIVNLSCYAYCLKDNGNYKAGKIYSFQDMTELTLPAVFSKADAKKVVAKAQAGGISPVPVPVRSRQPLVLRENSLLR